MDTQIWTGVQGPILLTQINFNPSMDDLSRAQLSVGWNYLSIPKLQRICIVEVWEWTSNFMTYFIVYVITFPYWDQS